ncbi:MAG: alpha/beta fold hydrolase, partial [Bacteroidota bacterium]
VFLGISCSQPAPEAQTVKSYTIDQFYKNIKFRGGSFSADDSQLLISSNETGIFNAFTLATDGSGKKQLTNSELETTIAIGYFPEDNRILFTADEGGNENYKLFMQSPEGATKDLTPYDSVRNSFMGWSHDLKSMFIGSNQRNPQFMDVYERSIASLDEEVGFGEMIYQNDNGWDVSAISKNKRFFALSQAITSADSKMYLYDRETGETKDISEHEGDVQYSPQYFNIANTELYYLTDENSEYKYLAKMSIETGEVEKVYEDTWDVLYSYSSYNEKYRVVGVNQEAQTVMHIFDNGTGQEIDLPEIPGASIIGASISRSEKMVRLSVNSSASPNNIYVYSFETGELTKLTESLNPEINQDDMVEGQVVRYASFDGTQIPAIYYQPKTATAENPAPGLVWVHGGPGGQSRLSYFELIQFLVNQGYAILAVNNRGSGGYGKTFNHMDDQNHGDGDLKDCIAGKDFFASTGVIDMEKVGIIGGSYGGYMVMAALAFTPEEFDVGVNIFGVTNWLRTLNSIPPYWESFRKALYDEMGDPTTEDSVRLYNISPLFHASNVTKPLMVLQGANDVRVLQVESDEIVEGVKANGIPVEYVIFDDEGHGFRKKENEIEGYGQIKTFLDQYLLGQTQEATGM